MRQMTAANASDHSSHRPAPAMTEPLLSYARGDGYDLVLFLLVFLKTPSYTSVALYQSLEIIDPFLPCSYTYLLPLCSKRSRRPRAFNAHCKSIKSRHSSNEYHLPHYVRIQRQPLKLAYISHPFSPFP